VGRRGVSRRPGEFNTSYLARSDCLGLRHYIELRYARAVLTQVIANVHRWESADTTLKCHLNGYVVTTRVGLILIDPPRAESIILKQIEALGQPRAVLLSGRPNERRAKQYQDWYAAKVFAPEADRRRMRVEADHYFKPGEALPGGFRSVGLRNQRTPGESVFFHEKGRLLAAGHLNGEPAGHVQMESPGLYRDFSRAFQEQLKLLELDFTILLPGRGAPILSDARKSVATFIAGYSPD
jgi:glyoxylase-like metal-dependent hydrolase (beta-lactamase superfamily II)